MLQSILNYLNNSINYLSQNEVAQNIWRAVWGIVSAVIAELISNWIENRKTNEAYYSRDEQAFVSKKAPRRKKWLKQALIALLGLIIGLLVYNAILNSGAKVVNLSSMTAVASSFEDDEGQKCGLKKYGNENMVDENGDKGEEDNLGNTYENVEVYGGQEDDIYNYNVYELDGHTYQTFCCVVYTNSEYRNFDPYTSNGNDKSNDGSDRNNKEIIGDDGAEDLRIRLYKMDGCKDYSNNSDGEEILAHDENGNENPCPLMGHSSTPQVLKYSLKNVHKLKIAIGGGSVVRIANPKFFKDADPDYDPGFTKSDWLNADENGILYLDGQHYFDSWNFGKDNINEQQRDDDHTTPQLKIANDSESKAGYVLCVDGKLHNPTTLLTGVDLNCQNFQRYWIAEKVSKDNKNSFTEGGISYQTAYTQIKGEILLGNRYKDKDPNILIVKITAETTDGEKDITGEIKFDASQQLSYPIDRTIPPNTKYIDVRIDGKNVLYISDLRLLKGDDAEDNEDTQKGIRDNPVSYKNAITFNDTTSEDPMDVADVLINADAINPYQMSIIKKGIRLYDDSGKILKEFSEENEIEKTAATTNIKYDNEGIKNDLGITLMPGTHYQYELFVIVDGEEEDVSEKTRSFSTSESKISETAAPAVSGAKNTNSENLYMVTAKTPDPVTGNYFVSVRPDAGDENTELGEIDNGTILTITQKKFDSEGEAWGAINYNGQSGYVALYVTTSVDDILNEINLQKIEGKSNSDIKKDLEDTYHITEKNKNDIEELVDEFYP